MIISELVQTCASCPSQWNGIADDGRRVYVRYRWGWLTVTAYRKELDEPDAEQVYRRRHGDEYDGTMSTDMLSLVLMLNSDIEVQRG
jgi:hypothetical protein